MKSSDEIKRRVREKIEDLSDKLDLWEDILETLSPMHASKIREKKEELGRKLNLLTEQEVAMPAIMDPTVLVQRTITNLSQIWNEWYEFLSEITPEVQRSLVDVELNFCPVAITSTYLLGTYYLIAHSMASLFYRLFVYNPDREKLTSPRPALRPIDKFVFMGMILIDQPSVFEDYYYKIAEKIRTFRHPAGLATPVYTFRKGIFIGDVPEEYRLPYVIWTPIYSTFKGVGMTLENIFELDYSIVKDGVRNTINAFRETTEWKMEDALSHIFFGSGGTGKSLLLLSSALFGSNFLISEVRHNYRTHLVWIVSNFDEYSLDDMRYDLILLFKLFEYLQREKISERVPFANNAIVNIVGGFDPQKSYLLSMLPMIDNLIMNGYADNDAANNAIIWENPFRDKLATCILTFSELGPGDVRHLLKRVKEGRYKVDAVQRIITNRIVERVMRLLESGFSNFRFTDWVGDVWKLIKGVQIIITLPIGASFASRELESIISEELRTKGVENVRVKVTGVYFVELQPAMYARIMIRAEDILKYLLGRLGIIEIDRDGRKRGGGRYLNSFIRYLERAMDSLDSLTKRSRDVEVQRYAGIVKQAWGELKTYLET